jgi:1,4-dihydroxy-2-naphthoyl-CoA synthase
MDKLVLVDSPSPRVRLLTLNRPDELNSMPADVCEQLHVELRTIALDRSGRAVILTGAGRGFCAGEYEDRQQVMATFSRGLPEAVGAFLEKRPAEFSD